LKATPGTKARAPSTVLTLRAITSSWESTATLAGASSTRSGARLAVTTMPGRSTAAGRMVKEGFDVGYGDVQAAYEEAARNPQTSPIGVYMMMDRSPSAIILPAASPVQTAAQLPGLTITGHPTDVALNTFEQYASKTGIDPKSVHVVGSDGNWKVLLSLVAEKKSDALFGYLSTSSAAVRTAGGKVDAELRFLKYRDAVPELYGSALMISRAAQIARELGVDFSLVSSGQEWRRPDLMRATGADFIVPVDFSSLLVIGSMAVTSAVNFPSKALSF